MVRHVILWKLKDMPDAEKAAGKAGIKAGLEGLAGQIPGLTEIHVYTKALPSSAKAAFSAAHRHIKLLLFLFF